jgi:thioesterase domain-containing protein/acyl carrier protein
LIVWSPYVSLGLWTADGVASSDAGSSRVFRTGDLVRQRPDGLLERMGRKDRQVKIRGARVDLEGVEAALRQHPLVCDAGALARTSHADGSVTLIAYVCARNGESGGLVDDLKEFMRSAPAPMRPGRFYLASTIPRLPSSKLDLRALKALDEINAENERADVSAAAEASPQAGDSIARTVAQAWQQALNTPIRGPEDHFFDAGGDSLKAIAFVNEIERALDLELPFTLIHETPTFAGFCQALREHRTSRYQPLVTLKAGQGLPPVFFIHGLGGSVAELFPMARRMTYPGAVIGIQARGLAGKASPHASVEEMAAEYLKEVKAYQPEGPYCLCGYSFGGLVAFEMARQLQESGDELGLVGIFDSMMSPLRWPVRTWVSIAQHRFARFAANVRAAPIHTWPAAMRKAGSFWKFVPSSVLKVSARALIASARYRPGFYPGELTLFSPLEREPGLPSLQSIWLKHARAISIVETAGNHWTMLCAPNARSTAACLTECLPGEEHRSERERDRRPASHKAIAESFGYGAIPNSPVDGIGCRIT